MGDRGHFSSVSLRGSTGSQVTIFIDGQEVPSGAKGAIDLSQFSLSEFERVEIYRNHVPARFGPSRLGGVIHLISRRNLEGRNSGRVSLSVGEFGHLNAMGELRFQRGSTKHHLRLERAESKGDYEYLDDNLTPNQGNDDVYRTRINNGFESASFGWHLDHLPSSQKRWSLDLRALDREKGMPGPGHQQTATPRLEEQQWHLGLEHDRQSLLWKEGRSLYRLLLEHGLEHYTDLQGELGAFLPTDSEYEQRSIWMEWQESGMIGPVQTLTRARYGFLRYQTQDHRLGLTLPRNSRNQLDLSTEAALFINRLNLEVRPNLSYILLDSDLRETIGPNPPRKEHESDFLPSVTFILTLPLGLSFDSSISRAVRHPTLPELFGNRGSMRGNSTLTSEKSTNLEAGFSWTLPRPSSFFRSAKFRASAFKLSRNNLIQIVVNSQGVGSAENIAKGEIEGLEIETSLQLGEHFFFTQGLSQLDHRIVESSFPFEVNKKLPGIYGMSWKPEVEWRQGPISIRYNLVYEEEMYYDRTNLFRAADKVLHDATITLKHDPWLVALSGFNLADEDIEDFYGWPRPGRHFHLSLERSF